MAIPTLSSCCCGCSLRTGTLIIGWLALIGAILNLFIYITALTVVIYVENTPTDTSDEANAIRSQASVLKAISIILIINTVCNFGITLILLLGVYKSKANLVKIWVLIGTVLTIIGLYSAIVSFFTVSKAQTSISSIITALLQAYFVLVVYSFYKELRHSSPMA